MALWHYTGPSNLSDNGVFCLSPDNDEDLALIFVCDLENQEEASKLSGLSAASAEKTASNTYWKNGYLEEIL